MTMVNSRQDQLEHSQNDMQRMFGHLMCAMVLMGVFVVCVLVLMGVFVMYSASEQTKASRSANAKADEAIALALRREQDALEQERRVASLKVKVGQLTEDVGAVLKHISGNQIGTGKAPEPDTRAIEPPKDTRAGWTLLHTVPWLVGVVCLLVLLVAQCASFVREARIGYTRRRRPS